jgi:hypothetical protein
LPPPVQQSTAHSGVEPLLTLTATETDFLSAAYDSLIPADRLTAHAVGHGLRREASTRRLPRLPVLGLILLGICDSHSVVVELNWGQIFAI